MRPEFGDFAGGLFTYVHRDGDHTDQGSDEYERDQPRRNVADSQGSVEGTEAVHCRWSVQKNLRDPRHHDKDEDEYVIPLQSPPDCLQLADLEARENKIFADEFFPFALQQVAILHHHRD